MKQSDTKNPFPGMHPWLESHWGDVHTCLTTYARDQRQPQLPPGLRARIEEYVAEPVIVPREIEPETLHQIQIVDAQAGHRIVTTIEFLSLANKLGGDGREQYRKKQRNMLAGRVNLVEIDLLRAGK